MYNHTICIEFQIKNFALNSVVHSHLLDNADIELGFKKEESAESINTADNAD